MEKTYTIGEDADDINTDIPLDLHFLLTTWRGDLNLELYAVAREYREWATQNPEQHIITLPGLLASHKNLLQAHKTEAVEYILCGRAPTREQIQICYDTWFFEVTLKHLNLFLRQMRTSPRMREILKAERIASAKIDPQVMAIGLEAAGAMLAARLCEQGPKIWT